MEILYFGIEKEGEETYLVRVKPSDMSNVTNVEVITKNLLQ